MESLSLVLGRGTLRNSQQLAYDEINDQTDEASSIVGRGRLTHDQTSSSQLPVTTVRSRQLMCSKRLASQHVLCRLRSGGA